MFGWMELAVMAAVAIVANKFIAPMLGV